MSARKTPIEGVQGLIDTYIKEPEGRKKQPEVLHPDFDQLPKDTRKLIEAVLKAVYRNDFEIVRKTFVEKLELYLRLIADSLQESKCQDTELQNRLNEVRGRIAKTVNEVEVSAQDIRWLRKIGFLPVDIFELTTKLDIKGVIEELKEHVDEYKLILGDEKYIVKILKLYEGFAKLKRLRTFYRNYSSDILEFNGSHLSKIVLGAGWEEKLKYFENPENLKRLLDAGFNGSHLSRIVLGAGWKEKLKLILTEALLLLLKNGVLTHHGLAKLLLDGDWKGQISELINK